MRTPECDCPFCHGLGAVPVLSTERNKIELQTCDSCRPRRTDEEAAEEFHAFWLFIHDSRAADLDDMVKSFRYWQRLQEGMD